MMFAFIYQYQINNVVSVLITPFTILITICSFLVLTLEMILKQHVKSSTKLL